MAYTRRTLATAFRHLPRRVHPSLPHLLHDSDSPPSPSPINHYVVTNPSKLSPSQIGGFYLPLGLQLSSVRFYSAAPTGGSSEIDYMKDVADVLTESSTDAAVSVSSAVTAAPLPFPGEVAAAAADSFPPVAALQYIMDAVHTFTGLNWWLCIALTTLMIRGATVPLLIKQMKATIKLSAMRPEMEKLKDEMQNSMDPQTVADGQKKMKELFNKHGVTPFTPLKGLFIQGPIFMSFFFAISNMVEKVPSFKGGGAFWFTDLTVPDSMYIFPVLTSLTFLATVELNMQEGMEGNPMANTMKNFSRGLAVLTIPFTASFPKAIFCYWCTSNLFSLVYGAVLKRPAVKKFFNLPLVPPQQDPPAMPTFNFFGQSKPPLSIESNDQSQSQSQPLTSKASSSAAISHRIRTLEKTVKARKKSKRR